MPKTKIVVALAMPDMPFCSGVCVSFAVESIVAILPISVCAPVATTTPSPRPFATIELENAIFLRSASGVPCGKTHIKSFSVGTLSPVSALSSHLSIAPSKIRRSAGTISPASSTTTSPTTKFALGIFCTLPPRITLAIGWVSFFNSSILFIALHSCQNPMPAFKKTMPKMIRQSTSSLGVWLTIEMMPLTAAAIRRIMVITSANCFKNITILLCRFGWGRVFEPYFSRRAALSVSESPFFVVPRVERHLFALNV